MNQIINTSKMQYLILLLMTTIIGSLATPALAQSQVTICHVAGRADAPANHITMTISENAVRGHFDENGTPLAGHEGDHMGTCNPSSTPAMQPETAPSTPAMQPETAPSAPAMQPETPTVVNIPPPNYAIINMGGHIWLDADADMERDHNEPGIANVSLSLWTLDGFLLDTVITQFDGSYGFSEVIEGQYRVTIEPSSLPAAWEQTYEYDLSFDGNVHIDALYVNQLNFGYRPRNLAAIAGHVWEDSNINGILENTEVTLQEISVTLFSSDGETRTIATNSAGHYRFTNLLSGVYTIQIIVDGQHHERHITLSQETRFVDFPLSNTRIISGTVWVDDNQNGRENPGERGFTGVEVHLIDANGQIMDIQLVQPNGRYNFMNVTPGEWTIHINETTIPGTAFVTYDMDGNSTFDVTFTLKPYQNVTNADFGIVASS